MRARTRAMRAKLVSERGGVIFGCISSRVFYMSDRSGKWGGFERIGRDYRALSTRIDPTER
jgi:hypothetical protein